MKTKSNARGFTLIELMIVVAIIGILASIAIPAYMNYTTRAQVVEAMTLAGSVKTSMAESYAATGEWPASLSAAGVDAEPSGKYVERLEVANGVILAHFGDSANSRIKGGILAIAPGVGAGGQVLWTCGYRTAEGTDVTWEGDSAALTTIAAKFLPSSCRDDHA